MTRRERLGQALVSVVEAVEAWVWRLPEASWRRNAAMAGVGVLIGGIGVLIR